MYISYKIVLKSSQMLRVEGAERFCSLVGYSQVSQYHAHHHTAYSNYEVTTTVLDLSGQVVQETLVSPELS